MLIALIGGRCSGKNTLIQHLVSEHSFRKVTISCTASPRDDQNGKGRLNFSDDDDLLEYATLNWRQDFVTIDLKDWHSVEKFSKRPWFILCSVEARLLDRWRRISVPIFEDFVIEDDLIHFGPQLNSELELHLKSVSLTSNLSNSISTTQRSPLRTLGPNVKYSITNNDEKGFSLSNYLQSISLTHLPKMRNQARPSWDTYFMSLAYLASLRSNCMKRRVGAVLVTHRDKRVLSTGYNGTPRGMTNCNEGGCGRCNGVIMDDSSGAVATVSKCGVNLNECLCLHAEENALLEAGRDRMSHEQGTTLYCNTCPCLRCSVKIVQCGIREVVYSLSYSMDAGTTAVFLEAGVELRQLTLP
ncbi:cytidine deaminase-like protein [Phakopsora pachyrhizi]|nr:cytidine deaminase-like protein [Phakopsora pachyrhizi]